MSFNKKSLYYKYDIWIESGVITEEEAKKNMINKDNNKKCDYDNTKAVVYPKEPYKKNSYNIRIQLDCGINKSEKDK